MQHLLVARLRIGILVSAVLLCALDALGAVVWTPLWFAEDHTALSKALDSTRILLWVAAVFCSKFPRSGLITFVVLLGIALVLNVQQFRGGWEDAIYNLAYAIASGVLLVLNLVLTLNRPGIAGDSQS